MPRTGTDAATAYFQCLQKCGMQIEVFLWEDHRKHSPFCWVPESFNKKHVLTIRRLPSFMSAYIKMCCVHGIYPDYTPAPQPSKSEIFSLDTLWGYTFNHELPGPLANVADRYIKYMTSDFLFSVDHCLRMENLQDDILDFVKQYMEVKPVTVRKMSMIQRLHSTHEPWSDEEIKLMYQNNPKWAELEEKYYGNLL